ncbi:MAG: PhzF family phenazine biosynthesis protein [Clostridia bacterium]|nr:PhzF family phenazine biosynthesis protein [Clostridia bacterium]
MKQYVVDAFTDKIFGGNPAAVCVMGTWLPDLTMMKIADENNLSETAFAVRENGRYHLRWFTPGGEVDLCGHATLATAFIIMKFIEPEITTVNFDTLSGVLTVKKTGDLYEMDFPAYEMKPVPVTDAMEEAIGVRPLEAFIARDLVCVLPSEEDVRGKTPDMEKVKKLDGLLLHTTARGKACDCVSRSYAPKLNVTEDPVCGSGHCHIIPIWAGKLKNDELTAYQASKRGGTLYCRREGARIKMAGQAALFSIDDILVSE